MYERNESRLEMSGHEQSCLIEFDVAPKKNDSISSVVIIKAVTKMSQEFKILMSVLGY